MTTETAFLDIPALNCEATVRRLWDYLDQQLSALDTRAVDKHLRDCKFNCQSHFEFERAFLDVVRSARPNVQASDVLRDRVRALMQRDASIPRPHEEL